MSYQTLAELLAYEEQLIVTSNNGRDFLIERMNSHIRASINYEWKCFDCTITMEQLLPQLDEYIPGRWMAWTNQL